MAVVPQKGPQGDPGPQGPPGPIGPMGELREYRHMQVLPSSTWEIDHYLGRFPAGIMVYDSSGTEIEGEIEPTNINQVIVRFTAPFSGEARVV